MDAVIDRLLKIKEFREDKAQLEVNQARNVLEEAKSALEQAKQHLDTHRSDCQQKERALYAELCTRPVRLWDIQCAALKVDEFKQSIQVHETQVDEAREKREASAQELIDARQRHEEAIRKREKFTELRSLSQADAQLEAARVEDLEMEEVPVKTPEHTLEIAE